VGLPIGCFQGFELIEREEPKLPWLEIVDGDPRLRNSRQTNHGRTGVVAKPTHLPVSTFIERNLEPSVAALALEQMNIGRFGSSSVDLDAVGPALELGFVDFAFNLGPIELRHLRARVGKPSGKVTVVGEKQRATGVKIKAPHGHDTEADALEDFTRSRTPLRIGKRRQHSPRLVKHPVAERCAHEALAVELDLGGGFGFHAEFRHDVAVYANAALGDHFFSLAARGNPGLSQDFLESYRRHDVGGLRRYHPFRQHIRLNVPRSR